MSSGASGIRRRGLAAYREGRLLAALWSRLQRSLKIVGAAKYAWPYVTGQLARSITLHCPSYVEPAEDERDIVERVFRAFKRMKEDQRKQSEVYRPSSMWQAWLDDAYSYLVLGAKENDLGRFHFFLANFGAWERYTGVESNALIRDNMTTLAGRMYLQNEIFGKQLKVWRSFYNGRKPNSRLTYPTYGNQSGAYIEDVFVGVGSFFNEIYGSMLAELVVDRHRPVIAELGAGYGKLAYFVVKDLDSFTFTDFDLPETLCLAAYYLMKVYPDKKVLLYGENSYSEASHADYDLIFMPSWEIENIGSGTVDLFFNKNSLGEMRRDAVHNYVRYIAEAARYFLHMNHETNRNRYGDGETGMLGYEYPIPRDRFRLLFRYPDLGHLMYHGLVYGGGFDNVNMDIFVYLYERK